MYRTERLEKGRKKGGTLARSVNKALLASIRLVLHSFTFEFWKSIVGKLIGETISSSARSLALSGCSESL